MATDIVMSMDEEDILRVAEYQRQADREEMRRTLDTLDAALKKRRGVMLAIEDELKKTNANLYGAGTWHTVPVAVTEVGRLANIMEQTDTELFGQPEVGSPGSGALDTATERAKGMRGKARMKDKAGKKRRSLPKSLRVKKSWVRHGQDH